MVCNDIFGRENWVVGTSETERKRLRTHGVVSVYRRVGAN